MEVCQPGFVFPLKQKTSHSRHWNANNLGTLQKRNKTTPELFRHKPAEPAADNAARRPLDSQARMPASA